MRKQVVIGFAGIQLDAGRGQGRWEKWRPTVSLGMRVLTVDDLGFDHRGGSLFMAHLRSREAFARASDSVPLSLLGIREV